MILLRTLVLLPQIVHNIRLGHRPNFTPAYIFGFVGNDVTIKVQDCFYPSMNAVVLPIDFI